MLYKISVNTIWEIGQRDNQEDCIFPGLWQESPNDRLFILCDGMGGHEAGEVASQTVCEAMSGYILQHSQKPEAEFTDNDLLTAVGAAYGALNSIGGNEKRKKMGTTMVCLKLHSKGCTIAHIGDSRAYHIRPCEGKENMILYQTKDHSLINDLIKIGELTVEEAQLSKQKNVITRAMQPNMERPSKPDVYHTKDIEAGDYFYLCSDGMLEQEEWDNTYIRNNFLELADQEELLVERLIRITDGENGSKDNHSAIIVHILEVINDSNDKNLTIEPDSKDNASELIENDEIAKDSIAEISEDGQESGQVVEDKEIVIVHPIERDAELSNDSELLNNNVTNDSKKKKANKKRPLLLGISILLSVLLLVGICVFIIRSCKHVQKNDNNDMIIEWPFKHK